MNVPGGDIPSEVDTLEQRVVAEDICEAGRDNAPDTEVVSAKLVSLVV